MLNKLLGNTFLELIVATLFVTLVQGHNSYGGGFHSLKDLFESLNIPFIAIWIFNVFVIVLYIYIFYRKKYIKLFGAIVLFLTFLYIFFYFCGTTLTTIYIHILGHFGIPCKVCSKNGKIMDFDILIISPMWLITGLKGKTLFSIIVAFIMIIFPLSELIYINIISIFPKLINCIKKQFFTNKYDNNNDNIRCNNLIFILSNLFSFIWI